MPRIYQYNDFDFRIVWNKNDVSVQSKEENIDYIPQEESAESLRCSLSRAKRMIREYSLCNDFQYFFTATVNSQLCDRFSLSECQEKIRKIMKSIKRKNKDFIYLFITEKHKDGAFHFHGLCSDTLDFYINKNNYISSVAFDTLGFNSFSKIKDKSKVSNYITKYITKDCVKNEQGSVYFCSRGLKRAHSYDIIDFDIRDSHCRIWQNDFVKICDFNVKELSQEKLLYFINNIKEKDSFLKEFLKKCSNINI